MLMNRKHIVMTVNNDCVADARVIKSAECLVSFGYRVTVVCLASVRAPCSIEQNGVRYKRLGQVASKPYEPPPLVLKPANAQKVSLTSKIYRAVRFVWRLPGRVVRSSQRIAKRVSRPLKTLLRNTYAVDVKRINKITGKAFAALAGAEVWALRPDVIHCHDLATLLCGVEAGRLAGVPVIYDAHELETERNAQYTKRVWDAIGTRERELIAECAGVVTVSTSIALHLQVKYALPDRPTVTFNAPDTYTPTECGRTVRDVCDIDDLTPLAVYVGLISVNRGLIDSVKSLSFGDHHLALVGPTNEQFLEDLVQLAIELGVSERLHVVDAVRPDQVVPFISSADASLMLIPKCCLSYEYCMPNKLFESALAGVPVIASDRKDMADFVRANNCGMVLRIPGPNDIARAIYYVKRNPDWFKMHSPITWKDESAKLRSLYHTVAGVPLSKRVAA